MIEFSKEKIVGSALSKKELTESDIETIMVNGIEGGIGYWAVLNNTGEDWDNKPAKEPASSWATKLIIEGKQVEFFDTENEDEKWYLTLDKLIKGFELNATKRPFDSDLENGDITTSDCIIQYALFGEIVYE